MIDINKFTYLIFNNFNKYIKMSEGNNDLKNNILSLIKSKFIMKKISDNLNPIKLLQIIKYNKKIQNKFNKDMDDYEKYSKIEIEIILSSFCYGKFINILNKKYFHIYLNDNEEENENNTINEWDNIKKIKIIIDYYDNISLSKLFLGCQIIEEINFVKFYNKYIKDMSQMFYDCSFLRKINISNLITDNATNMSYMFSGCTKLEELNLSKFKTNNVINMCFMFNGSKSLKELNLY